MKSEPRKKVVSLGSAQRKQASEVPTTWFGKYGNTLLTGILIALSVALLVRWRLNSAAVARQALLGELHDAGSQVDRLRTLSPFASPADLIRTIQSIDANANGKLSDVLNSSADADVKAQALVIRGDLYWQLANLPALPGASTEPSLRMDKPADQLLKQAAEAYGSVVNSSEYSHAYESVNAARLGLAAVAENQGNWVEAVKQLDAVKNDPNATGEKMIAAEIQLRMLSNPLTSIQDPTYVAPPSGTPASAMLPTSLPTTAPASQPVAPLKLGPAKPATMPTVPVTRPGK